MNCTDYPGWTSGRDSGMTCIYQLPVTRDISQELRAATGAGRFILTFRCETYRDTLAPHSAQAYYRQGHEVRIRNAGVPGAWRESLPSGR